MAEKTYDFSLDGGYQGTRTYREANPDMRKQYNRYKKEYEISDEHMFLLMFQRDLDLVPYEERTKGDTATYAMIVVGFLLLWYTLQGAMNAVGGPNVPMIFIGVGSFVLVAVVYYTGILNPYKRAVKEVHKRLKDMPEVPDFDAWNAQHPMKQSKSKKRRK